MYRKFFAWTRLQPKQQQTMDMFNAWVYIHLMLRPTEKNDKNKKNHKHKIHIYIGSIFVYNNNIFLRFFARFCRFIRIRNNNHLNITIYIWNAFYAKTIEKRAQVSNMIGIIIIMVVIMVRLHRDALQYYIFYYTTRLNLKEKYHPKIVYTVHSEALEREQGKKCRRQYLYRSYSPKDIVVFLSFSLSLSSARRFCSKSKLVCWLSECLSVDRNSYNTQWLHFAMDRTWGVYIWAQWPESVPYCACIRI